MGEDAIKKIKSPKGRMVIDMMAWKGDLVHLTVLGIAPLNEQRSPDGEKVDTQWRCLCKCGNIVNKSGTHLRSGFTKSCGVCSLRAELTAKTKKKRRRMFEEMNEKTLNAKFESLTALEQKVYLSVPIKEAWKNSTIIGELARKGLPMHPKSVLAILNKLAEQKLVIERPRSSWRRITANKPFSTPDKNQQNNAGQNQNTQPSPVPSPEPITGDLQMQMTHVPQENKAVKPRTPVEIVDELLLELKKFSGKAESAALEIAEYIAGVESQAKKLEKFKELFKEMGA